jgi:hypothetical protein
MQESAAIQLLKATVQPLLLLLGFTRAAHTAGSRAAAMPTSRV